MMFSLLQREIVEPGTGQAAASVFFLAKEQGTADRHSRGEQDASRSLWQRIGSLTASFVPAPSLYSELYDHLRDDIPVLTARSVVSRAFLPRSQHHLFRHITFYLDDGQCARFFVDKAPLIEELAIFERRLPNDRGMRTDAWARGVAESVTSARLAGESQILRPPTREADALPLRGIISPENMRELVFLVTSEVDGWMSCSHELFNRAPRLERETLLDWRGTHQNVEPYMDRYEIRRALVPKNTKVDAVDTAICALDWTRRMLDPGTPLERRLLL
ncbi:hypothetical protein EDD18DRAFT_1334735 [Armillaria luteobubalina]|uniref:Uncharacterized protein n=1 Tax=Armillaria luteobubalina TaxID=153913 RepID=A0AA39URW0_9AGAR|nr:hypothetical protein EDD18DRAFT_1334735 [Armillaria luteobubalina]